MFNVCIPLSQTKSVVYVYNVLCWVLILVTVEAVVYFIHNVKFFVTGKEDLKESLNKNNFKKIDEIFW